MMSVEYNQKLNASNIKHRTVNGGTCDSCLNAQEVTALTSQAS